MPLLPPGFALRANGLAFVIPTFQGRDLGRLERKSGCPAKLFHVEQFWVNGTGLARHVVSSFVLLGMNLRKIMPKCASCSEWGFLGAERKNRGGNFDERASGLCPVAALRFRE